MRRGIVWSPRMASRAKDQNNTMHNNNAGVFTTRVNKKHQADAGDSHREGKRMILSDTPENVQNEKVAFFSGGSC